MKKVILISSLFAAMAAGNATADTLLGFKVGADYWQADTSGTFANVGTAQPDYNFDSSSQGSLWVSFEHPIPLIPNVMVRENRIKDDFSVASTSGKADLSNTDFVLYYELLDNDLVSLDVGGAYKLMHGSYRFETTPIVETEVDSGVVMAYANAMVGIPGLGLFGFADVMAGLNETSVHDFQLGLGWHFDGIAVDTRVRVGYRQFNFDVNDFSGTNANLTFDGVFAGVELDF
ncbi:TIGR04219 family outer membrane beta-barrel protein [Shewanella sp. NIFS-20-20]|uniref:TIGR04219 family outer membrane beta-barrel protein n=1 Tax=Shewanella sp. NIFS-20-20 TaxID=2853806 RepID=UPI001C441EEC|nr:TIGR04219 family outer membrane beta-barrel protein [Shewanella sp. NIFS-20-20]MBV7317054.1 TIGR04219 family outer membrane beta-barrel protein [Shewanella sp. NIFS-20-20]